MQKSKLIVMRRTFLALILACSTLALSAQGTIKVNSKGAKPTVSDFAWAVLSYDDNSDEADFDESRNAVKQAWIRHQKGMAQEKGVTLTIDEKNGYVCYELKDGEYTLQVEMCYWNEADGKHKLFAYKTESFLNGMRPEPGQYDGLVFYRYDNATKKMTICEAGIEVEYSNISYALPRSGKDITVTRWNSNGTTKKQTLKWNGHGFN